MARPTQPNSNRHRNPFWICCWCGAWGIALLACTYACGENTERVITKIPETTYASGGGGAGAGSTLPGGGGAGASSTLPVAGSVSIGPPLSAKDAPIGYAAIGTGGTTGGGRLPAILVENCKTLSEQLNLSDNPAVLVIEAGRVIDCTVPTGDCSSGTDAGIPGCSNTCILGCDSTTGDTTRKTYRPIAGTDCSVLKSSNSAYTAQTPTRTMVRNEGTLYFKSNKTLLGMDAKSTIRGANLYLTSDVFNIIIQNLTFENVNPTLIEAGDAITINGAHHVWIDHCSFSNISDAGIDVTSGTYVTYSFNHFYGVNSSACGAKQNSASTLSGASTVTVHHNYFDNTLGCSPKVTDTSKAHIFNNLWQSVAYYSVQVADTAQATLQGNSFSDSKKPYYGSDSCLTKSPSCAISATGNVFDGVSTTESQDVGGTVAPLPYDSSTYTVDDAGQSGFKDSVTQRAGPTLTFQ